MVLKEVILNVANEPKVKNFALQNNVTRKVASRFVAGDTLEEAIQATQKLNHAGLQVSLDHLGENVSSAEEAEHTAEDYITILDQIKDNNLLSHISIKLTALGLDISDDLCRRNVETVLERASQYGIFVRVDMEGSAYTERTIRIVTEVHQKFSNIGTVMQAYLYRTADDIEQLLEAGVRIRLVKGAYREPREIAYPRKSDVDRNYLQLMKVLLSRADYPAIATHDEKMIAEAKEFAQRNEIDKSKFEFQMLYGIRRDLQAKLFSEGYNVRVYVPYGTYWYPYLTRRMAERPANLMFVVGNVFKG